MANVFETLVTRLINVGFYDFLLFLFSLTFFFAILKKTKVLGESPITNGIIAFVAAFLIFSFPMITGIASSEVTFSFTNMFAQIMMWGFVFMIAMLIASFFYPDLPKLLGEQFGESKTILYMTIILGIAITLLSGVIPTFISGMAGPNAPLAPEIPLDVINLTLAVIIFLVIMLIGAATVTATSD